MLLTLLSLLLLPQEKGITVAPTPVETVEERETKRGQKLVFPEERRILQPRPQMPLVLLDSLKIDILLQPDSYYVMKVDLASKKLCDSIVPKYKLTPKAKECIEKAPNWLKVDLIQNLTYLPFDVQNRYADIVLENTDPKLTDELCFQIAHLAPSILQFMDPRIIKVNAEFAYKIAPDLKYVQIVDYGNPLTDKDYYSTTKYRIRKDGSLQWAEVPKEIYYWWVIMPKGTDELPLMGPSVYDMFWREYFYYSKKEEDYTAGGYPLLKDVLANVEVYWDGKKHVWPGGRPHSDTMSLVNALGWWLSEVVPVKAWGNRPIQPNIIIREHNGNCGELQDALLAAGRTALIPILGAMNINEDHVWNAVWWPGDSNWYPYQVDWERGATRVADSTVAMDVDRGGGKWLSCVWDWRGDGYQYSSIEIYSKSCTLTVYTFDKNGVPYPEQNIRINSEYLYGGMIVKGFAGITDRNGEYTTTLGDFQNYYIQFRGKVIDSAEALPGARFFIYDTIPHELKIRTIRDTLISPGADTQYTIQLKLEVPYEIGRGLSWSYEQFAQLYAKKFKPGVLSHVYITNKEGVEKFIGEVFRIPYYFKELNFTSIDKYYPITVQEDHYIILYNRNPKLDQVIKGTIYLYKGKGPGIAEVAEKKEKTPQILPPITNDKIKILCSPSLDSPLTVKLYNSAGRKVIHLTLHPSQDNLEISLKRYKLPPGIYFVELDTRDAKLVKKVILL